MRNPEKIRVLLVDDHALVRQGLRKMLEADPRIDVVGEAEDGERAIESAARLRPTVALIDIGLPGMNGIEAASRIRRINDTVVLMVSMHADEQYLRRSLEAGARGYVLKDSEDLDLARAVMTVARGDSYFSPALHPMLLSGYLAQRGNEPSREARQARRQ